MRADAADDAHMTATAFAPRGLTFLLSILAALVAAFAFSGSALAEADSGAVAPAIASDKADYAPGELVTLNGSNWRAGETVTIDVNDDEGQSWRRTVDVVADADGKIVDQFTLPDHFVAVYTVTATGPRYGGHELHRRQCEGSLECEWDHVQPHLDGVQQLAGLHRQRQQQWHGSFDGVQRRRPVQ